MVSDLWQPDEKKPDEKTEWMTEWVDYDKFDDLNEAAEWLKENKRQSRIRELEEEREKLKYDIDGRNMETVGLVKRYKNMRIELLVHIVTYVIIIVFLFELGWGKSYWKNISIQSIQSSGDAAEDFIDSILGIIIAVMIFFLYIVQPAWQLYINSSMKSAKKIAGKHNLSSVSNRLDETYKELSVLENRLREVEEEYEQIKSQKN